MENEKKGFAIAGLVLGIIGTVLAFIPIINTVGIIIGVLGLIFAIIGLLKSAKKGLAIAATVLSIAAIVIAIIMKVSVISAVDKAVDDASSNLSDMTGENTDKLLKEKLDVNIGEFTIEKGDFLDDYKLNVTVTNKGKEKSNFNLTVEAVDENGTRLETDSAYIDGLAAGQSQTLEMFKLITSDTAEKIKNATFKVSEVSAY